MACYTPPGALGKCNVNWAVIYAVVMSSVLSRQLRWPSSDGIVARSTFRGQNVKNITDKLWRFRCRFAWQAQGIVHLVKSRQNVRVLRHFQLQPPLHSNTRQLQLQLHLHCIPLHSIHYTTLNYTQLHSITRYYTTLHYTTVKFTTLHPTTPQLQLHKYTPLHSTTLNYITLHYITLHYTTFHYT